MDAGVAAAVALADCGGGRDAGAQLPPSRLPPTMAAPVPRRGPPHPSRGDDPRPVIAAFGDSLSAGFGSIRDRVIPTTFRACRWAGFRYRVVNLGVSGDTTTDGVRAIAVCPSAKPAIVILEFGGNDGFAASR